MLLNSRLALDPPDAGDVVRLNDRNDKLIVSPSLAVILLSGGGGRVEDVMVTGLIRGSDVMDARRPRGAATRRWRIATVIIASLSLGALTAAGLPIRIVARGQSGRTALRHDGYPPCRSHKELCRSR